MSVRKVMVVTGTRAEFGLLRPVMHAINDRPELELHVVACGSHLVQPALTFREVKVAFEIADSIPMQTAGKVGRHEDVEALGKGISRFGRSLRLNEPDWVVVLGDRIEAFAAASAASIGGYALAHIHGGDRAEGVADEAMRHAITKLAHLHLPATNMSADRIARMGEDPDAIHVVGSPAIDGIALIEMMNDAMFDELGSPEVVVMMHPIGRDDDSEFDAMNQVLDAVDGKRVLVMHPNLDPGRRGILRAIESRDAIVVREHLPRNTFVALLKRIGSNNGALVGNSSAGLIECSAIGCASVDIGARQHGRERCAGWTIHADENASDIARALREIVSQTDRRGSHPYGDGHAGVRIAQILATIDPHASGFTRKHCVY